LPNLPFTLKKFRLSLIAKVLLLTKSVRKHLQGFSSRDKRSSHELTRTRKKKKRVLPSRFQVIRRVIGCLLD